VAEISDLCDFDDVSGRLDMDNIRMITGFYFST
jgi:hypothetical protein